MRLRDAPLTDRQLAARAERAQGLLQHAGWDDLARELEAWRADLTRTIVGGVDDYVMYRQYCGSLEMVEKLLQLPSEFIAQAPKEGSPDE